MTSRSRELSAVAPAPRHALGWAALVYAIAVLTLAWPALGGGFLVNPVSDQYIAGFPFREFAAQSLKAGNGIPLWNPYQYGGMPYVAAMHGDIFYPTFLLRMVLPTDVAMTWSFIIHLFLAGLFTYVFLRRWGVGFLPSLVGGLAYMLSGQIASLVSPGHDGKLYVSALFPLVLWLLVAGIRDGRAWAWGGIAITIGLGVLTPHPQLLQYMLLGAGAFALYLAFAEHPDGRLERGVAVRRLLLALGGVAIGFLIGAIQYLPVMEYVSWSPRSGGRGYDYATSFSMPIEELFNTYLPQFTGILDRYWGRNGIHFHSEYIGASVLLLAGAAFGAGGRRGFKWFWLGTLIVSVLWALGGNTPFYRLVYTIVPGSKFFRAPSTIFFISSFAVAVLAALGVERALAGKVTPRYLVAWVIGAAAVALLATLGGLTAVATTIAGPERYELVQANGGALTAGAWRSFLFVALTAGALLVGLRGRLAPTALVGALLVVITLDLWSVLRHYWRFSPPAEVVYASDPTIEYVKGQPQPGRVMALPLSAEMGYHDPFLMGAGLMVHDVRTVEGYHGNEIGRYQQLVRTARADGSILSPNFWALTNARYLLTNVEVKELERLVGPVRNAAGTEVSLYRLPGDNPLAWVTPAIVKAPDDAVFATILDPRFDVRLAALFDTSAAVTGTELTALPEPLDSTRVTVAGYEPGRISLRIEGPVPEGAGLVVSENYYPGWTATVDGAPATIGRADYSLIGVELPANARSVELAFESQPYRTGKLITLVTAALALALTVGGAVRARGRRG